MNDKPTSHFHKTITHIKLLQHLCEKYTTFLGLQMDTSVLTEPQKDAGSLNLKGVI